ncbi:hypothetical protein LY78DRAFT_127442 [Colletotrichum sublineola]|nr:hypothetical protein LY78DRAFT_127442 [Colletotrichum sublineola]
MAWSCCEYRLIFLLGRQRKGGSVPCVHRLGRPPFPVFQMAVNSLSSFLTCPWFRLVWSKKRLTGTSAFLSCLYMSVTPPTPILPGFYGDRPTRAILQLETFPSHTLLLPCAVSPQSETAQVASLHISISRQL